MQDSEVWFLNKEGLRAELALITWPLPGWDFTSWGLWVNHAEPLIIPKAGWSLRGPLVVQVVRELRGQGAPSTMDLMALMASSTGVGPEAEGLQGG